MNFLGNVWEMSRTNPGNVQEISAKCLGILRCLEVSMFCYVLLCFAMLCYVLLCVCYELLRFVMFYYALLCFAMLLLRVDMLLL